MTSVTIINIDQAGQKTIIKTLSAFNSSNTNAKYNNAKLVDI